MAAIWADSTYNASLEASETSSIPPVATGRPPPQFIGRIPERLRFVAATNEPPSLRFATRRKTPRVTSPHWPPGGPPTHTTRALHQAPLLAWKLNPAGSMQLIHDDVSTLAARLDQTPEVPAGNEERFAGWGVMAVPFVSGDILAMRHFPASSLGHGYTSVWHRDPSGAWTFWTDQEPLEACPRYFGSALKHSVKCPITVRWTGPHTLEVEIPTADLRWTLELRSTASTLLMNGLGAITPERLWHSPRALDYMGKLAGHLLHAGRLCLSGHAPNGQSFLANPRRVWTVKASSASLGGRDLGAIGPVPEQAHLADFWIPQRGLFAIGTSYFEPADPSRHHLVAQAPDDSSLS
jgi:hypothetical protein